jgi:hypothetical protein
MKQAYVFLRSNMAYIHAMSQTTQGAWIRWPPFLKIAWNDGDANQKLNEVMSQVLDGSRRGVPHPVDWSVADADGFYKLAHVKSWRQFVADDCKLVEIEMGNEGIRLLPQEKRDKNRASVHFVDYGEPIMCTQVAGLDWKSLLSMAFDRCK